MNDLVSQIGKHQITGQMIEWEMQESGAMTLAMAQRMTCAMTPSYDLGRCKKKWASFQIREKDVNEKSCILFKKDAKKRKVNQNFFNEIWTNV